MSHRLICEGVTHFIKAANIMCFSETDAATGLTEKASVLSALQCQFIKMVLTEEIAGVSKMIKITHPLLCYSKM